jgi:TatD DNase family protein
MFIDSHAHIFYANYKDDLDEVLRRAEKSGVTHIVVPGTNVETSKEAIRLAERREGVYACVGIHPHEASSASDALLREIEGLSFHPRVVAIGEIGLDYHYNFSPKDRQREVFQAQIDIARRRNLPIVVHTRESIHEAITMVRVAVEASPAWRTSGNEKKHEDLTRRGVFHCFTGSAEQCRELFRIGFFVSFPGIVTFKNSPVVETVREIGVENILLETDSPYMAPVPYRGKRNEPAHVVLIAQKLAELLAVTPQVIADRTSQNAKLLFGIP